eukprot:g2702.t1
MSASIVSAKILMVITTASAVPWGRFSTAYFVQKGISATQIGTLRLVGFFAKAFAYPTWGLISDYTKNIKGTLIASILLCGLSLLLLRSSYVLSSFTLLLFVKFLRSGLNAVWPLTEAFALQLIKGKGYGRTRMYCAISWGLCSFVVGYIIDNSSYGIDLVFYLTWLIMLFNILLLLFFIPSPEVEEDNTDDQQKNVADDGQKRHVVWNNNNNDSNETQTDNDSNTIVINEQQHGNNNAADEHNRSISDEDEKTNSSMASIIYNMKIFFSNKDLQQFYIILSIYGFCFSLVESLLFIVLEKDYHASKTVQGLCIAVSVIFEIPVFHFSDYLLEKYKVKNMFVMALLGCATRLFLYFLTPLEYPGMIVCIQLLHGCCFAVMWVAAGKCI